MHLIVRDDLYLFEKIICAIKISLNKYRINYEYLTT